MKKTCPSCNVNLISIRDKYCSKCEERQSIKTKHRHKQYKEQRTDLKEQSFYNTSRWRNKKNKIKFIDGGYCLLCKEPMDLVHHIEELKEAYEKRLDENNLISLCESCHQKVHIQYRKSKKSKKNMQNKLKNLMREFRNSK